MQRYINLAVLALSLLSGIAFAENPTPPGKANPTVLDNCAKRITTKTIHEGMTKEQVTKAWGTPPETFIYPKLNHTNANVGSAPMRFVPITEVWNYKVDSVFFNGNIVTSILDGKYDACIESAVKSGRIWK